jgi:hypothetical protein
MIFKISNLVFKIAARSYVIKYLYRTLIVLQNKRLADITLYNVHNKRIFFNGFKTRAERFKNG